jgi:hypothetical protein
MASPSIYASGLNLAGTVFANGPATLQLGGAVYLSGATPIIWLDTIGGNDANAGTIPELPVKTMAVAYTNSAAIGVNGLIVVGEGSSESLSGSQSFATAGMMLLGCGVGSSRPRYTCTGAVDMWAVSAAGVWIEGFYYPASTAAATSRVAYTAANGTVRDCYFECGASDTNRALRIHTGANSCYVKGTSFVTTASRPAIGLEISAAVTDTTVENLTFNGGSYGWSDRAFKVSAAATRVRNLGCTFTNRSDLGHTVTATTYQTFGLSMGGTADVLYTA